MKAKIFKICALLLALSMAISLAACGSSSEDDAGSTETSTSGETTTTSNNEASDITIGVSIWRSTDVLGSQCKAIIDKAANALGVTVMYVDQRHVSEHPEVYQDCLQFPVYLGAVHSAWRLGLWATQPSSSAGTAAGLERDSRTDGSIFR